MFENIMKFFKNFNKKEEIKASNNSKDAAKERLHLVLMQDRANVSADFLELMKQEIIEVIKKYIDVDENAIDVRLTNKENEDGTNGAPALYANIPIVNIKNEARQITNKETRQDKKEEPSSKKDIAQKEITESKQDVEQKEELASKEEVAEGQETRQSKEMAGGKENQDTQRKKQEEKESLAQSKTEKEKPTPNSQSEEEGKAGEKGSQKKEKKKVNINEKETKGKI